MTRTRMLAVVLGGAVLLAAATARADGGPSAGIEVGWGGVRAPGGQVRYVALPGGGPTTTVVEVRIRDGIVRRYGVIAGGGLGIPRVAFDGSVGGLSLDGRTLVLASLLTPGSVDTRFAVVDTRRLRLRRTIVLRGRFAFDALSPDGRVMYVTEYTSQDGTRYRVRRIHLVTGRLERRPVLDKTTAAAAMRGYPLTRATEPAGRAVYTLYRNVAGPAFVHALDTVARTAICIELPWSGELQDALWAVRLTLRHGGRELVLRQQRVGTLAVIDTVRYRVRVIRSPQPV